MRNNKGMNIMVYICISLFYINKFVKGYIENNNGRLFYFSLGDEEMKMKSSKDMSVIHF